MESNFPSKPKKYITISDMTGFGSTYHAIMSGIAWSAYMGYGFIFTPLQLNDIPSNKAGNQDKFAYGIGRDKELNDFIGVKSDEKYDGPIDESYKFIEEVHFADDPNVYYTQQVLDKIKKMYYSTEKPKGCKYDIAIHIRRGDVGKNTVWNERYVGNLFYVDFIQFLREKHPNYNICIYSEGSVDDFKELKNLNIHFALNDDIKKTFHDLVTAKILVTTVSSFSYAAALLSEGSIYYLPMNHRPYPNRWPVNYERPLNHWNPINMAEYRQTGAPPVQWRVTSETSAGKKDITQIELLSGAEVIKTIKNINVNDILLTLKGEKGGHHLSICEIENSPHFKVLNGDDTEYLKYTEKHFTPNYVPEEVLMDFKKLATDFEYLKEDYETSFITITKHESGRYRTVDGDHRLTIMKHRGHENVLCEMI